MHRFTLAAALIGGLLQGCTYTVQMISDPMGAVMLLPDGRRVATPTTVQVRCCKPYPIRIEAPGYRPLEIDLHKTEGQPLRFVEGQITLRKGREVKILLRPDAMPYNTP